MSVPVGPPDQPPGVEAPPPPVPPPAAVAPPARRRRSPAWILILVAVVVVAGVAFVIHGLPGPTDNTPYGVSNPKIDSSTQIEFDYRAKTSCNSLVFDYKFFNASGSQVDEFQDESQSQVTAGKSYHFTITASGQQIDSSSKTFTADPTCHD
jgi:hypothetical protein